MRTNNKYVFNKKWSNDNYDKGREKSSLLGGNKENLAIWLYSFLFSETEERLVLDVGYSGLIAYKMTLDENTPNTIEALRIAILKIQAVWNQPTRSLSVTC